MSLSFLLLSQNITLTETFGVSFTLTPGNYLLKVYSLQNFTDLGYKLIQELKTGDMVKTYQDDYSHKIKF